MTKGNERNTEKNIIKAKTLLKVSDEIQN